MTAAPSINRLAARTKTVGLEPKRDHRDRLEWDRVGRCTYRVLKHKTCDSKTNNRHSNSYTDEYGERHQCPDCRGSGSISYFAYVRVPEFDAPKASEDWVPDWIET